MNKIIKITLLIAVAIMLVVFAFVGFMATMVGSKAEVTSSNNVIKKGEYYFDFDEITYYSSNISDAELADIRKVENKSLRDKQLLSVLKDKGPQIIDDSIFIDSLEVLGFYKIELKEKDFGPIREIFRFKKNRITESTKCMWTYRDILIFRREKKIIGFAKVCFDCGDNYIVGTNMDTEEFGQSGDYGKLYDILKNYANNKNP